MCAAIRRDGATLCSKSKLGHSLPGIPASSLHISGEGWKTTWLCSSATGARPQCCEKEPPSKGVMGADADGSIRGLIVLVLTMVDEPTLHVLSRLSRSGASGPTSTTTAAAPEPGVSVQTASAQRPSQQAPSTQSTQTSSIDIPPADAPK